MNNRQSLYLLWATILNQSQSAETVLENTFELFRRLNLFSNFDKEYKNLDYEKIEKNPVIEKEEVKKYIDGVTVNPEETYDFLDKIYAMTKTTKQKQRLIYVHVAEYCIEKLAGEVDIVAVSSNETT